MKKLIAMFLKGVFVLAPIMLTFFIIYKIYELTDGLFKGFLLKAGIYFPGLGAIVTVFVIFLAGLLASNLITNNFIKYFERALAKIPLLGSLYGIFKDTLSSFSTNKKGFSRLVRIDLPNGLKLLGFLTNDEDQAFIPHGYVVVYLMQSMQWAGNIILVPENMVEFLEVSAEDALKFIASAGLLKSEK
ncbi:MAG: DUF502 domain-containing protein [Desulfitobacteriaceae bacterium]|nr:DUF502 domain-containing protein [Desulfitobacteriaceae bacterium]MDD4346693.1 DUF502 domain-containing protein [Desulfitobacteriaceae bacterium]MDD4401140.1 DUF502 domain-containing protein [Desulfitobacteriaceae bacterium]